MGVFEDYFIRPVLEHTGYNLVNTMAYAVILIAALFFVYKMLAKTEIKLDGRLWIDLLPFVFLGGMLRALQDINFFGFLGVYHALFVTPMIYVIIFLLAFAAIKVSRYLWKDFIRLFGVLLVVIFAVPVVMNAKNFGALFIIVAITFIGYSAVYLALRYAKSGIIRNSFNSHILAAHLLDASAAFVAVSVVGGYKESGVFTSLMFSYSPGWMFIPLKAVIALLVIHFIDKEAHGEMKWILKFAVLVLGLGPGLHDAFSVLIGSNMA